MKIFEPDVYLDSEVLKNYFLVHIPVASLREDYQERIRRKLVFRVDYSPFSKMPLEEKILDTIVKSSDRGVISVNQGGITYLVAQRRLQDFLDAVLDSKPGDAFKVRVPRIEEISRKLNSVEGNFSDS
ncbi:MAG: hypothetical protein ABIE22_04045 [archaeon]